jgi:ribose transport system permease protein
MSQATVPGRAVRGLPRLPGLHRVSALYLLGFVLLLFGTTIPESFLTATTAKTVAADMVVVGILGLAVLVPLTAGVFDLSVGSMLAFSLVVVSAFAQHGVLDPLTGSLVALLACAAVGLLSGLVVVRLRVNSFIATLAVSQILTAATLLISANQQITGVLPAGFLALGRADVLGVPVVVLYLVVLALVVWYVLECTPLGRHLLATGANPEAARLSGVRTGAMVAGSLVGSALLAGIAGLVYGAKVGSFSNSFGPPLLFPAFAAVFLGATQFLGRPNVWGTILAVYTLAIGVKGLQLTFASGVYWITPLFNGVALVVAVGLASRRVTAVRRLRRTGPGRLPPDPPAAEPAARRPDPLVETS